MREILRICSIAKNIVFHVYRHVHRSGHIEEFVISSEEAISKGIRRIIALTGPEAIKVSYIRELSC